MKPKDGQDGLENGQERLEDEKKALRLPGGAVRWAERLQDGQGTPKD